MTSKQRELKWPAADGTWLAGTLQTPGPGEWPGVLILNGSGPLDRNSAMKGQALGFAGSMAGALASVGIASLRFDKRGVGLSGGGYLSTGFCTEVADATAALAALAAAPEVDAERVSLVGHSVGAIVAARLAAADPTVASVVMLAGPARSGDAVLEWQGDRIASSLKGPAWLLPRLFRWAQRYSINKAARSASDTVRVLTKRQPAKWMREYMAYDPHEELQQVRCPVLAITGSKDLQVDPADVQLMRSLVAGPFTGETPVDLTHLLRQENGPAGILTYASQLKRSVDQALLQRVATWIADQHADLASLQ